MKAGASATLFGVRLPWELAQEVSRAPAAAPKEGQPSTISTGSASGSTFFNRTDASAGFWWAPGTPKAPRFALLKEMNPVPSHGEGAGR